MADRLTADRTEQYAGIVDHGLVPGDLNQLALIRNGGSDAVIAVTFWGTEHELVEISNAETTLVTISSTAKSLPYFLGLVAGLPAEVVGCRIKVNSGSVRFSDGGTVDGSAGAGNGIADSHSAPSSSSTGLIATGNIRCFGRISVADAIEMSNPLAVTVTGYTGATTIADGADTAEGQIADAAVTGDTAGSVSAKLRGLTTRVANNAQAIAAGHVADTVLKASAGRLMTILVTASGATALLIYDNATGHTGTIIGAIPANVPVGPYIMDVPAASGITVKGDAANPAVTVTWS